MNHARRQDGAATSPRKDADKANLPLLGIDIGAAIALASGVLMAMRLPQLPPTGVSLGLLCIGAWLGWRSRQPAWRLIGVLIFGFGWASLHGLQAMDRRLPPALAGEDVTLRGRVVDLPEARNGFQRFDLRVESAENEVLDGTCLRLSWYGRDEPLHPGEKWTLTVRLRRPRGVLNPGGFDFERYALERGIAATGYVRDSGTNARIAPAGGLDAWRGDLSDRLAESSLPAMRFVRALALGDTRGFDGEDWETLRASGLSHLFAISGFHVGMAAGLATLLAGLGYRLVPTLGLRVPRPQGAAMAALLAALAYSAAAGFSIPTQRSLLMIAAVLLARLLRRPASTSQAFALALIVLLLVDPLAVLGAGFWLSFLGVGWLLWCLPREVDRQYARSLLTAQGAVTFGLLPLTVWFFGQASLIGPLLNLVAIPLVTLAVVPLSLLGAAAEAVSEGRGAWPLWLAAQTMEHGWFAVRQAAQLPWAQVHLPEPDLPMLMLAIAGVAWRLMPRGTPARGLGLLLCLPLVWPARSVLDKGAIELGVVDVGQGLAVLVGTSGHRLLYDTGPAYAGGLDLGEAAVVPALLAQGIGRIDVLVLSHGDNDHAGGHEAVLRRLPPAARLAPASWGGGGFGPCLAGQGWSWDGVRFEFLHPPLHFPYLGNDTSCVLRISGRFGSVLLPGDIGEAIEARLVKEAPEALRADVLIVPHHGSRTSSSEPFVVAVEPSLAVYAIGHRNRFGFPREEVRDRYTAIGALREDSAAAGFLRIRLDRDGVRVVERRRESHRRFWHESAR